MAGHARDGELVMGPRQAHGSSGPSRPTGRESPLMQGGRSCLMYPVRFHFLSISLAPPIRCRAATVDSPSRDSCWALSHGWRSGGNAMLAPTQHLHPPRKAWATMAATAGGSRLERSRRTGKARDEKSGWPNDDARPETSFKLCEARPGFNRVSAPRPRDQISPSQRPRLEPLPPSPPMPPFASTRKGSRAPFLPPRIASTAPLTKHQASASSSPPPQRPARHDADGR